MKTWIPFLGLLLCGPSRQKHSGSGVREIASESVRPGCESTPGLWLSSGELCCRRKSSKKPEDF